jgi:RNA polymerase sigma-70 factor, ECF subfamily
LPREIKVVTDRPNLSAEGEAHSTVTPNLLLGLKSREPQAWERLTAMYLPLVYRRCVRMGLSAEDAADVAQEVFLTVSRRIDEFVLRREGGGFRPWLWSILRNKLGDFFRIRRQQVVAAGGSDAQAQMVEVALEETEGFDEQETGELYHRALALIE